MSNQRTHYVTTADGVTIGGTVHGQGPPLVFLQGAIGDGDLDWHGVVGHLTDRYTCYLPSYRGRGLSGDHPDLSLGRLVDDVLAYVNSIGEPTGVVGWSGGAAMALGAAAATSDEVNAVASVEPGMLSLADEQEQAAIGEAVARMAELAAEGDLTAASRAFAGWPFTDEEVAAAADAGYFEAAGRYVPSLLNGLQQWMEDDGSTVEDPAVLGAISAPVLVLLGSDTRPFFTTSARHVVDHVPNAQIRKIPGAAHAAPLTHPEFTDEAGAVVEGALRSQRHCASSSPQRGNRPEPAHRRRGGARRTTARNHKRQRSRMTMDTTNRTEDKMDKDMKVLPVEGSELTYRVTGVGPPVLLMHGGFGVIEVWDEIAADLATTHRVIAYDRRGHGRSPNGTPDMRVHARDAAELIQHVAEGPAIVVGWSGGASVALETVRSHADQVRAAVVVEPPFRFRPGGVLRLMLRAHLHWLRGRNRAAAETIGRTFFSRRSGGNGWDEIDDERRELLLGDAEGLRVEVRPGPLQRYGGSLEHIKAKDIAGWSTPMTCLVGEDTLPALARCHDRLTSAAPQARTIEVPGACHLIPWQQPEAVVSAIRSAIDA